MRGWFATRILTADDTPHRLALGVAMGVFIAFTPTYGFQMLLVAVAAWLFRANAAVGMALTWITNVFTAVPIYCLCYTIGCLLMWRDPIEEEWWAQLLDPPDGSEGYFYLTRLTEIGAPLWLGGMVVGFIAALPCYWAIFRAVRSHQASRLGKPAAEKAV